MKNTGISGPGAGIMLILAVLLSGCSTFENLFNDSLQKEASGEADNAAGRNASGSDDAETAVNQSAAAGAASGPQWNQLMISQAQMAFNYAFSAGGMWAGQAGYKPGEFTEFEWVMEGERAIIIERAYLKEASPIQQWWRVSWEDEDGSWIWEALIDIESSQMLRMRARDPDGNQGEVPVSGQTVYMPASELTPESVQGATVDKGKVDVPAGRFQADHVVYLVPGGGGQVEFWLAPQIPGGVVKYSIIEQSGNLLWTSDLSDYGKHATTILGSF